MINDTDMLVHSNGLLDPWHGGGVLHNSSDSLIALIIPNGAHHLDLRASNSNDPKEVTLVREKETSIMKQWIKEWNLKRWIKNLEKNC